ncbi:MAG: hypothetical protein IPI57_15940 [Candidatus Competibacteraceae bacterium]|nr:hypothetical protein [Candidatus Competibacteraceae bacterium]
MLKKITLLSAILPVATALTEPCFGPGAYSVVGESGPSPGRRGVAGAPAAGV